MLHIIKTEWLKVKSYRTFWILVALGVVSIFGINFAVAEITGQVSSQTKGMLGSPYDFPTVWQMMANINNFPVIFFAFLIIILTTNEFTFKTHRQNIIDGWSRLEFVRSKMFWVVLFAVVSLLMTVICGISLGLYYGKNSLSFDDFYYVWYYFGQTIIVLTLALLLSVLIKRAGLTIVVFMAYVMGGEQILVQIGKKFDIALVTLLPLQSSDEMMPYPLFGKMVSNVTLYSSTVYLFVIVLYIGLFSFLAFRKIQKADL